MCEGRHLGADVRIEAVGTDTRSLPKGALFVALRGENFDAHDLVAQAEAAGAGALLLHRDVPTQLPRVLCADTEEALGEFAAGMQKDRPAVVVALTGSNGKTSVKMLTHAILARAGRTYINPGNRNNEIGLPLAVIDAPEDAQFAIYEMGAGKPGDIAYLASIVPPQVALVNNVAPAHMERMGSLFGIAETKGAIYEALPDDGVAVINADDAFAPYYHGLVGNRRSFRFGVENDADVHASAGPARGRPLALLPAHAGGQRRHRAAAAGRAQRDERARREHAGAGRRRAVSTRSCTGWRTRAPVKGRQIAHSLDNGAVLVDDSYNANPGSVLAAIATLAPGRRRILAGARRHGRARRRRRQAARRSRRAGALGRHRAAVDRRQAQPPGQPRLRQGRRAFRWPGGADRGAARATESRDGKGLRVPGEGFALERDGQGRQRACSAHNAGDAGHAA